LVSASSAVSTSLSERDGELRTTKRSTLMNHPAKS
jgi:hypothetical protein